MPPQQPEQLPLNPETPKIDPSTKRKKVVGGIILAAVLLIAALLLIPASPLALIGKNTKGAKMMVGDQNRFIYACSVLDITTVGKELGLNQDKTKQGVEEAFSFDPSSKEKSVNLLKLTGDTSVTSSCKAKFDRAVTNDQSGKQVPSFINVSLMIEQFGSEKEASDKFASDKSSAGKDLKALNSYADSSYYTAPLAAGNGPTYVQPAVKHKNMVIYFTAPLKEDDPTAQKMTAQLDTIAKDVIKRIDAKEGEKPKDFSGTTSLGNNKFVDSCQSVDYAKFGKALAGNIQYEPTSFVGSQYYGTDDGQGKAPKHLLSVCTFNFRTQAEADTIANKQNNDKAKEGEDTTYKADYPHFALVQILTTENKEAAQKIVSDFKKSGDNKAAGIPKIEDVKIGDVAIKVNIAHTDSDPFDNQLYYIAKDAYTYLISVSNKRQSEPFKTTAENLTDDQARKLLDTLIAGTAHAQKQ